MGKSRPSELVPENPEGRGPAGQATLREAEPVGLLLRVSDKVASRKVATVSGLGSVLVQQTVEITTSSSHQTSVELSLLEV
jgi:hypothetical protein